jgi:hypothetical protein
MLTVVSCEDNCFKAMDLLLTVLPSSFRESMPEMSTDPQIINDFSQLATLASRVRSGIRVGKYVT